MIVGNTYDRRKFKIVSTTVNVPPVQHPQTNVNTTESTATTVPTSHSQEIISPVIIADPYGNVATIAVANLLLVIFCMLLTSLAIVPNLYNKEMIANTIDVTLLSLNVTLPHPKSTYSLIFFKIPRTEKKPSRST